MSSRFGTSLSGNAGRASRTTRRRGASSAMSERQTQAYLIARDALRHMRRISSLGPPPSGGIQDLADRSGATQ